MVCFFIILYNSCMLEFIIDIIMVPYAHAQGVDSLIGRINEHVLNPLITLLFAVAFVRFIVGLFNFFQSKGNGSEEGLEKGKSHMLWGIIGMVIMVSVFGIMSFLTTTLQTGDVNPDETGDVSGLFDTSSS